MGLSGGLSYISVCELMMSAQRMEDKAWLTPKTLFKVKRRWKNVKHTPNVNFTTIYYLPWSFPRIVRFGQQSSRCHSENTIGCANISPNKIFSVLRLFSKPNIFHLLGRYDCITYASFKSGVDCSCTFHKSFVSVHFRYWLIQSKVFVWICKGFCTKLYHSWICDNNKGCDIAL